MDEMQIRKSLSQLTKKSKADAKRDTCYICEMPVSSFCNSHIIPQFVLRAIALDGELIQSTALAGIDHVDNIKGVKNSGVFHLICNECDSQVFSDYESPDIIVKPPTNRLLAQIALKNHLLDISKRLFEKSLYSNVQDKYNTFLNKEDMDLEHDLDLRDYAWSYRRAKKILDKR